ncbi:hypothetical protein NL676_009771 [Syzygium grande]|nr:hypothetical protein NL676_009771 [Syzygium grande]
MTRRGRGDNIGKHRLGSRFAMLHSRIENERPEIAEYENPLPSRVITEHPPPPKVRSLLGDDELLDQFAKGYKTPGQQPPKPFESMVAKTRHQPLRSKGETNPASSLGCEMDMLVGIKRVGSHYGNWSTKVNM